MMEDPNATTEKKPSSPILRHFAYNHLPMHLQGVSMPFGKLAQAMDEQLMPCAEKSAGLRKLLEAKDCMIRAYIEGTT